MNEFSPIQVLWVLFVTGFFIVSFFSWRYLYRIYKDDPEPLGSWLLEMLHIRALIDILALGTITVLFYRSAILGFAAEHWTRFLTGISILFLATGPVHKALVVVRQRMRLGIYPNLPWRRR